MESKQNSLLVILLSSLLIISCLIAGFFAYRTQNLVKEITKLRTPPAPVVTATPSPDPTADWRLYSNKENQFEFKFPKIFIYPESIVTADSNHFSTRINLDGPREVGGGDLYLETTVYKQLDGIFLNKVKLALKATRGDIIDQPFQPIGKLEKISETDSVTNHGSTFIESAIDTKEASYLISIWEKDGDVYVIKMFALRDRVLENQNMFNEITSSFKFIGSAKNSSPVACTMDAKLCDDGSYVGRSGPKCEFAACPTTSPRP